MYCLFYLPYGNTFYILILKKFVYIIDAIIPIRNPDTKPMELNFPLYSLLYSGVSSPETMYIIAPAAYDKLIEIIFCEIFPIIAPNRAPIPVDIPERSTNKRTLFFFIPPFFIGTAIEMPSGMSWIAIEIAKDSPSFTELSNPVPIANPSG